MVHITDIFELKSKLNRLKHQLDKEDLSWESKKLANKYLNKAIDYVKNNWTAIKQAEKVMMFYSEIINNFKKDELFLLSKT